MNDLQQLFLLIATLIVAVMYLRSRVEMKKNNKKKFHYRVKRVEEDEIPLIAEEVFDESYKMATAIHGLHRGEGPYVSYVLYDDKTPVAVCSFMRYRKIRIYPGGQFSMVVSKERVNLFRLVVGQKYRRQGHGSYLVKFMLKQAKKDGFSRVSAVVDNSNFQLTFQDRINFYLKLGFRFIDIDSDSYLENVVLIDLGESRCRN